MQPSPKTSRIISHFLFAAIWAFAIYTGAMGIDFGRHWDERKLMKSVRDSVPYASVLPGWYNYPSMIYDLVVLSSAPEIITAYLLNRSEYTNSMEIWLAEKALVLRARIVFLCIVTLSLLWVYLLLQQWTGQWMQALLGSAILASAWEVSYHARWLAPDGILMQFGILVILLAFLAIRSSGKRSFVWLTLAAIAAGLACGTKYYGGIFLLPVFLTGFKVLRDAGAKPQKYILVAIALAGIFAFVFVMSTPGSILETDRFIQDIQFEIAHYQSGHPGYTVEPGWQHFTLLASYLSTVFFSKYAWFSICFFAFALMGLFAILRENPAKFETWIFLSVPLFYIPYISLQKVMMVRNDLLLFPFLAVLSARGIAAVWNLDFIRKSMTAKFFIPVLLALGLSLNFIWLVDSATSILTRRSLDQAQALQEYLLANPGTTFYLSTPAKRMLPNENIEGLQNVVNRPSLAEKYIYLSHEVENPLANRRGVYDAVFGPYEVNFDYYPSWDGDSRVIIMPMDSALRQSQFGIDNK